jgi:hypothetical protein
MMHSPSHRREDRNFSTWREDFLLRLAAVEHALE